MSMLRFVVAMAARFGASLFGDRLTPDLLFSVGVVSLLACLYHSCVVLRVLHFWTFVFQLSFSALVFTRELLFSSNGYWRHNQPIDIPEPFSCPSDCNYDNALKHQ